MRLFEFYGKIKASCPCWWQMIQAWYLRIKKIDARKQTFIQHIVLLYLTSISIRNSKVG